MRIIGIDPGSRATGFGIIEVAGTRLRHVAHGVLRTRAGAPLAERLAQIHRGLATVVTDHGPECAVVERVFVAGNPRSAIVLGEARGAALAALAGAGLPVDELAAREVKQAVTGRGGASKQDVQAMVCRLLALEKTPASDAADALAVAITRARAGRLAGLDVRARRRRPRTLRELGGASR